MTKMKLAAMLGVATQLTVFSAVAYADGFTASTLKVYAADPLDIAPVKNGRLQKKRYNESNEMATVKLFADGNNGVYIQMQSGSIDNNGTKVQPVHRQQIACTPIKMVAGADGAVSAQVTGPAKFITDNVGQDYRNANFGALYPVDGGSKMLVLSNYRPQGTNDTNRYAKVVDNQCNLVPVQNAAPATVQKQVLIMQKDNDNCDMSQTGEQGGDVATDAGGSTHITLWAGCNGNGKDDGWINDITVESVNERRGLQGRQELRRLARAAGRAFARPLHGRRRRSEHRHLHLDRRQQPAAARRHLDCRGRHRTERRQG